MISIRSDANTDPMGFYLELTPCGNEFRETRIPGVFWFLYLFAGLALFGMGASAFMLLRALASQGGLWDQIIVASTLVFIPIYLLIGVRLISIRKFVRMEGEVLKKGYRLFGKELIVRDIRRHEIENIELINQRPSPNIAPKEHDDSEYFIQGHWRVVALLKNRSPVALDRHNQKGALVPMAGKLRQWVEGGPHSPPSQEAMEKT